MGMKLSADKTVSEAAAALQAAIQANRFGDMRVHNLNRNPASHRKTAGFRVKPGMTVYLATRKDG